MCGRHSSELHAGIAGSTYSQSSRHKKAGLMTAPYHRKVHLDVSYVYSSKRRPWGLRSRGFALGLRRYGCGSQIQPVSVVDYTEAVSDSKPANHVLTPDHPLLWLVSAIPRRCVF